MIDINTFLHLFHEAVNAVHHTASQVHDLVKIYGLRVLHRFCFAPLALHAYAKKLFWQENCDAEKGRKNALFDVVCVSVDLVVDKEYGIRIDCLQS